jgi:hypothetical protein
MTTEGETTQLRARLLVWWIIWATLLGGVLVIYFTLGRRPLPASGGITTIDVVGLVQLTASITLRWLFFPRLRDPQKALVAFVIGLAMAESCSFLDIFLSSSYRDELFVLGALGIVQWMPLYARALYAPAAKGFRAETER